MSSIGTKETKGQVKPRPLAYYYGRHLSWWCQCDFFYRKGQHIPENLQNQTQREYLIFLEGPAFIENLPVKTQDRCNSDFPPHHEPPLPTARFHRCLLRLFWIHRSSRNLWPSSDSRFCMERYGHRLTTAWVWKATGVVSVLVLNNPLLSLGQWVSLAFQYYIYHFAFEIYFYGKMIRQVVKHVKGTIGVIQLMRKQWNIR